MTRNTERWGPLLKDCDLAALGTLPYGNVSTFREIQLALGQIINNPASVTCSTLESILSSTRFPTDLPHISGARLAAWCLKLTRAYTEENELFDHLYGLRCIQLLALALQIDVLQRRNLLVTVIKLPGGSGPQPLEFNLANAAAQAAAELDPVSTDVQLRLWTADLTIKDREFLLLALWHSRKSMFRVCGQVPGVQGWMLIFMVIWLPLIYEPKQMDNTGYYRLNDLVCRYALAAKDDKTYVCAHYIFRWINNEWKAKGLYTIENGIPPDPADLVEMPSFRDTLATRLVSPADNRLDLNLSSILLEFVVHYHLYSPTNLSVTPGLRSLFEAVFQRMRVEIEDDRCLSVMAYRHEAGNLVYSLFQTLLIPFSGPIRAKQRSATVSAAEISEYSTIFAGAMYNVDWVCLLGRILLMPTLPFHGRPISVANYEAMSFDWEDTLRRIQEYCEFLVKYDHEPFQILRTSFPDWRKTHEFIQLERSNTQLHPVLKKYWNQTQKLWALVGKTLGFLQVMGSRCAYTGCPGSKIIVTACSRCLVAYYCSVSCQRAHFHSESWNSHAHICCLERAGAGQRHRAL
ncbi:hypothetical protein FRC08_006794 [Ceratobasidium sp. 394]|nr:hypothetical protein FRC08_006794 [Ceratobasidium sp. 394]KAG9087062.1 hypothetical protein FS749_003199 [Ceratobasidium sp. UAMH 11750]